MTFVVGYAPTDTQAVGKKHALWTALDGVMKEVPPARTAVCVNGRQRAHGSEGGRRARE